MPDLDNTSDLAAEIFEDRRTAAERASIEAARLPVEGR
jgi:hypothetical protein